MELLTLENERLLELAARWLADPQNRHCQAFEGNPPGQAHLRAMSQDRAHLLRVFTADQGAPIGLVGLSGVNRDFRTALRWALLGERRYAGQGYLSRAAAAMLTLGFTQLRLDCVSASAVDSDPAALRILK